MVFKLFGRPRKIRERESTRKRSVVLVLGYGLLMARQPRAIYGSREKTPLLTALKIAIRVQHEDVRGGQEVVRFELLVRL